MDNRPGTQSTDRTDIPKTIEKKMIQLYIINFYGIASV